MRKIEFLYLSLLFVPLVTLAGPFLPTQGHESNYEGELSDKDDHKLLELRNEFLTDSNGVLEFKKIDAFERTLTMERAALESSAEMGRKYFLIHERHYENDKASQSGKEALKDGAEQLAPFNFALENIKWLKSHSGENIFSQGPQSELLEKTYDTLLFYTVAHSIKHNSIFHDILEAPEVFQRIYKYKLDDSNQNQATDLVNGDAFIDQNKIQILKDHNFDLSKFDPASSAVWSNTNVETYDPLDEQQWAKGLFPERTIQIPEFDYERMSEGNIKVKVSWLDPHDLNKKGKPKKKKLNVRLGWEGYTTPVVGHFYRMLGYPTNPTTYRDKIKINLNSVTWENFISQWNIAHSKEMGSALSYIERIPGENAIYINKASLEAYPDDSEYRKMGPFRMGENGLSNRRAYRAMVLLNGFVSLQDSAAYQVRADAWFNENNQSWKPLLFISDISSALGSYILGNQGTVNEFDGSFTSRSDENLWIQWYSRFNYRSWNRTTYSDLKWLARRMLRISAEQINIISRENNFPEPVQALYREKFKMRLNKMIVDFQLNEEGFQPYPVVSFKALSQQYPEWINEKGYLKEGAQNYPGNNAPLLGPRATVFQGAVGLAINQIQNGLIKLITSPINKGINGPTSVDMGVVKSDIGVVFSGKRTFDVNNEYGPGQKRYLLKDSLTMSVPIGFNNDLITTPIAVAYVYHFEYIHSVDKMAEVGTQSFFNLINPLSIYSIRKNLKLGEQLIVRQTLGGSVGNYAFTPNENARINFSLMGLSGVKIKELYFAKTNDDFLEVAVSRLTNAGISNGFDTQLLVRFALNHSTTQLNKKFEMYRLDKLNKNADEINQLERAFEASLVQNDFSELKKISPPETMTERTISKGANLSFLIWNLSMRKSTQRTDVGQKSIYTESADYSLDRGLDRLWYDKIDPGKLKSPINLFGKALGEGSSSHFDIEAVANADKTGFESLFVQFDFQRLDQWVSRNEFDNQFKPFFAKRAGEPNLIPYQMPKELKYYSPLLGIQHWQIGTAGVKELLKNYGATSPQAKELISEFTREIPANLNGKVKDQLLRKKVSLLKKIVKKISGMGLRKVSQLRTMVSTENLWIWTQIREMLDITNPTFMTNKSDFYFAPEIGKFQGHTFSSTLKWDHELTPLIYSERPLALPSIGD